MGLAILVSCAFYVLNWIPKEDMNV